MLALALIESESDPPNQASLGRTVAGFVPDGGVFAFSIASGDDQQRKSLVYSLSPHGVSGERKTHLMATLGAPCQIPSILTGLRRNRS